VGVPLAYWAKDNQGLHVELAFVDDRGHVRAEFGTEATRMIAGRAADYSPFTALTGSDGRVRIRQGLDDSQSPVLAMGDSETEQRVLLGHWKRQDDGANGSDCRDNWALVFRDPSHGWREYLDIGATTPLGTKHRTGYVEIRASTDRELSLLPK
jgi:hypothetical protein